MIEQMTGPGSSGIAEKSSQAGKQAANGLFAKLMAMLEKHGKAGEKSALIQAGKKQATSLPQQTSILKQHIKGAQTLLIAGTEKHATTAGKSVKEQQKSSDNNGSTAQAVAVHVLTQLSEEKISRPTGSKVLTANKQTGKAEQPEQPSVGHARATGSKEPAQGASTGSKESPQDAGKAFQRIADKTTLPDMKTDLHGDKTASTATQAAGTQQAAQHEEETSARTAVNNLATTTSAASVKTQPSPEHLQQKNSALQTPPPSEIRPDADRQATTGIGVNNKADALPHLRNNKTGANPIATTAAAEGLVAHTAQKITPQQQTQPSNSSTQNGTVIIQPTLAESARSETGAQSGDKGSQDSRSFQILSADNRSSASSSVSGNNFQQYLNHKPVPTMTMFDSIQHIAQSAKNGQTKLEIQLDPANLGKIHISLQTDASKQIQIHMIVDQSGTRTAMDQQLPAIRHALAEQGLNLSGFSMGSHGGQASSGFGNRQSSGGSQPDKNSTDNVKISTIAANRQSASHSDSGLSIHI